MEEEKPLEEKTTDEKISEIYNDKGGFGSMKDTYNDVRKKYPTIKYKDVQNWYRRNVDYNVVQRGQNSFVAKKPFDEFQLDLFFMKGRTELDYTMGVAVSMSSLNLRRSSPSPTRSQKPFWRRLSGSSRRWAASPSY